MNRKMKAWRRRARWSQFREALPLYVILICDYKVHSAQTFHCPDFTHCRLIPALFKTLTLSESWGP
uniref:SWI/SNF-related matrix-associated actin-dependent regulator of chromatin subfamily C member 2 n=1 Tax=Pan troglodytes TaxID=9598 RepID=G2HGA9_PANTR|nr:SWI/SNF-related matrix-associated actin-dependent regulator of chromatin subfamily C member 2 [Pan troglodytes]